MKTNNKFTTTSIEELLRHKETTLQKFFDLVEKPDDIKHLTSSNKLFRNIRSSITDALNECKDINYYCNSDTIDDIKECSSTIDYALSDIEASSEELDRIIGQWEIAYENLETFLIDMINREDINLIEYTNKIDDAELKSYNRIKIVNKLLGK